MTAPSVALFCDQPNARFWSFLRMAGRQAPVSAFSWNRKLYRWERIATGGNPSPQASILHFFSLSSREGWECFQRLPREGIRVVDLYDTAIGQYQKFEHIRSDLALLSEPEALTFRDPRAHRALRAGLIPEPPGGYAFLPDPVEANRVGPREKMGVRKAALVGWVDDLGHPQGHTRRLVERLLGLGVEVVWIPSIFQREEVQKVYADCPQAKTPKILIPANKEEYWKALQDCDFGICPGILRSAEGTPVNTAEYLSGCGSSRLADYCGAGLGVVLQKSLSFLRFYAARNAPWFVCYEDPDDPVLHAVAKKTPAGLRNHPPIYTEEKISRALEGFYQALSWQLPQLKKRPGKCAKWLASWLRTSKP